MWDIRAWRDLDSSCANLEIEIEKSLCTHPLLSSCSTVFFDPFLHVRHNALKKDKKGEKDEAKPSGCVKMEKGFHGSFSASPLSCLLCLPWRKAACFANELLTLKRTRTGCAGAIYHDFEVSASPTSLLARPSLALLLPINITHYPAKWDFVDPNETRSERVFFADGVYTPC